MWPEFMLICVVSELIDRIIIDKAIKLQISGISELSYK